VPRRTLLNRWASRMVQGGPDKTNYNVLCTLGFQIATSKNFISSHKVIRDHAVGRIIKQTDKKRLIYILFHKKCSVGTGSKQQKINKLKCFKKTFSRIRIEIWSKQNIHRLMDVKLTNKENRAMLRWFLSPSLYIYSQAKIPQKFLCYKFAVNFLFLLAEYNCHFFT
jgi:hypothetical protein